MKQHLRLSLRQLKFKFGTVTDGVYKSEYNGIQFKAPDGWIYATSEQIAKMNDMDKDYLSLAQEQVTSKVAGLTSIYDMQCAEKQEAIFS